MPYPKGWDEEPPPKVSASAPPWCHTVESGAIPDETQQRAARVATILCVGTAGPEDPTHACLPFVTALTAIDAGHRPQIALMGNATALMVDSVGRRVAATDWPPLPELVQKVVHHDVPIYLCEHCARRRGVSGDDLVSKNARFASPQVLLELKIAADKVLVP